MPEHSAQGSGNETVSLTEAAARLNVHEKTLRRWIRMSRIPAELTPGPYGPQYRIPVSSLNTATHVLEVVKVERPTDPQTLALAVAQALTEHQRSLVASLTEQGEQLSRLSEQLAD